MAPAHLLSSTTALQPPPAPFPTEPQPLPALRRPLSPRPSLCIWTRGFERAACLAGLGGWGGVRRTFQKWHTRLAELLKNHLPDKEILTNFRGPMSPFPSIKHQTRCRNLEFAHAGSSRFQMTFFLDRYAPGKNMAQK